MGTTPHELRAILEEMQEELKNPANHYMISASYFEYISPEDRELGKHFMAIVYLHQDSAWNLELSDTNLDVDVLLNPDQPKEKYRIRIPVKEIWSVQISEGKTFKDSGRLFYSAAVFKNMLRK